MFHLAERNLNAGGSARGWVGSRCYRYGRDSMGKVSRTESGYSGLGEGEVSQKRAGIWSQLGLYWCEWRRIGSVPNETRS
jgi:hypothetical protein